MLSKIFNTKINSEERIKLLNKIEALDEAKEVTDYVYRCLESRGRHDGYYSLLSTWNYWSELFLVEEYLRTKYDILCDELFDLD